MTVDWPRYEAELREQQSRGQQQFVRSLPWMLLGQLLFWATYYSLRSPLGFAWALAIAAAVAVPLNFALRRLGRRSWQRPGRFGSSGAAAADAD